MHYISTSNWWFIAANNTYKKSTKKKSITDRKLRNRFTFVANINQTSFHFLAADVKICSQFSVYFCHLKSKVDKGKNQSEGMKSSTI
jgi:hypothetical protein